MNTLEARHIEKAFGRTHALRGLTARPALPSSWFLWAMPRAFLVAGLGVLGAVLAALFSRRRLRRTVAPVRLRTE